MLSLNIQEVGVFNKKYTQGIKQTWSTSSASTSLQNGGGALHYPKNGLTSQL